MAAPTSRPPAALALSAEQKQKLVSAVAGMLRAVAAGQAAAFPAEPAELRDVVLAGAFISLKRGRHLRSCCGMMGQPVTLARALEHAADRTIWEDERFPPVSPTELGHLDIEVWLLSNPQRVAVPAAQRPAALTIGKHGIVISRGQSRGLFLPGVATENNWDAERFLDQVCVKAGLHPSSWRDDATELATFEGEVVKARVDEAHAAPPPARLAAPLRAEDIAQFIDICRANLVSMLQGMTPRSFWNLPDGQVNGVLLLVQRPGSAQAQSHLRVSLRPTIPLQATLYGLVQAAVQTLAQNRIAPVLVDQLQLGLAILHDPALHGTAADPHLAGYDPEQRALLVLERNKSALVFDPRRTAAQLLEEASRQARLNHPELAPLYSLDVVGNVAGINTSNVPHPVRGPATRPPAVAGTFYDSDGEALSRLVERLLEGPAARASWSAAMVPHAGLIYSGKLAADVLKRIQLPRTIIVLGPKHTTLGMDWAVAPQQTWAIPGAEIASDFMLARKLSQAIPGLELDAVAHQREHAIEVELPFLARLAPEARVVGIALGQTDLDGCRRFARGLAEVVRGCQEKPLLLISSDMNHFATDSETRRLDALALEALERGDPALVHETVTQHNISMCGVVPAVIVLETLRLLGESPRGQQVGYATSADATGDTSRVVGYAGMLFR
jgi:AmmeMemoRadiSam system protein B/AmmeMemoRadiSam system protein A